MPLALASGLFVSVASFTRPVQTQGPTGNLIGTQTPVTGLQNIPCMDAPDGILKPTATEAKSIERIMAEQFRHVLLGGYYANVPPGTGSGWQVTIDSTLYDLLGAENDSQRTQTRLHLQLVTI